MLKSWNEVTRIAAEKYIESSTSGGGLTDAELRATPVPVTVQTSSTTAATSTSLANSLTNATLLANNTLRKSASIYNDDTAAYAYIKFGVTASATSAKIKIAPGGYFEFPQPIYTGQVDYISTAATGNLLVSEES